MVDAAINLTIGVAAGTENATASADVAVAVAECSSPWMAAFRLAASLCAALIVTHTLTVCYIGWRDLSGQWDKYALIKNRAEGTGLKLYVRGLCKFVFDILFMLLPALTVVCRCRLDAVAAATRDDPAWLSLAKQLAGYHLGELWVAGAHKAMHHPWIYARVHKRHHCPVPELVASVAWLDTAWEFCWGEIPALSMALMVLPTNPFWHGLFFAYQGLASAADHAGFAFNDENGADWLHQTFFCGEFHYYHHLNPKVNFAEEEWIDHLFGTHHTTSSWWQRYQRKQRSQRRKQQPAGADGDAQPIAAAPAATNSHSRLGELFKNFPELLLVSGGFCLCGLTGQVLF